MLMANLSVETVATESNTGKVQIDGRIEPIQRKFAYSELLEITNNFKTVLGKGGFGEVYHGFIDDTQVAVKMISSSSVHGYQQFESEAGKQNSRIESFFSFLCMAF